MALRVYLSHSVAPHELGAIYGMAELAQRRGMEPIVPDRRWKPFAPPTGLLQNLDAFVVVATRFGQNLDWVNAELPEALRLGLNHSNVISVVDAGLSFPSFGESVVIERNNFWVTSEKVVHLLEGFQMGQSQRNLLAALVAKTVNACLRNYERRKSCQDRQEPGSPSI